MIVWLRHFLGWVVGAFRSREDIILENLALRQQLLALHAQRPRRRLTASHKLFWVVLRRCWARWKEPLIQVTPRTVVGWHRAGFRLYWKWLLRAKSRGGRKPVSKQIRALIFQMVAENPTWGAPRIDGELLKLGFDLSEPTVSRWVRRAPRPPDPGKRWLTFWRNHREAIAVMDFFTVPTLTFSFVYSAKAAQLSSHGEQQNATSGLPTNDSQCESATHSLRVYPFLSCFHLDYARPHQRFNSLCVFCTICCSGSSTLASAALSLPITVSRNVDKPLRLLRKPSSFVSLATSLARPNIRSESSAADP